MAYNINSNATFSYIQNLLRNRFSINLYPDGQTAAQIRKFFRVGNYRDFNDLANNKYPCVILEYPKISQDNIRRPLFKYDICMYMWIIDDPASGSGPTYFKSSKLLEPTLAYERMEGYYWDMIQHLENINNNDINTGYFEGGITFTPMEQRGKDRAYCLKMNATFVTRKSTHGGLTKTSTD